MRRLVVFAMLFAVIGLGALSAGRWGAQTWERLVAVRVGQSFETLGIDWAAAAIDGLRITVSGRAPDGQSRALALGSLDTIARGVEVVDLTTVDPSPLLPRPPLAFDLLRDADGISVTGNLAGEAMHTALLKMIGPDLPMHDFVGVGAQPPRPGWGTEIEVAVRALRALDLARISVVQGRVGVEGIAADARTRDALADTLAAMAGDRVELLLDLSVPRRVIAPFLFAMQRRPGEETPRFEACAARDEAERAELEALVDRLDPAPGSGRCEAGLGGPEGDWAGAVAAGVAALGVLPAGRIAIDGNRAVLTGFPPTDEALFTAAMTGLATDLPAGFELTGRIEAAPEDAWTRSRLTYWLRAEQDAGGAVTLTGVAPGAQVRDAIAAYGAALFGTAGLTSDLGTSEVPPPPGWHRAALIALSGLAALPEGAVELSGGRIELTGRAASPEAAAAAHGLIAGAGTRQPATSRITIDLPATFAAQELPTAACAARIDATLAATPILFEAGARGIAEESHALMARLSAILGRCPGARFEIAGHTDSQGAEDMNLRLSRARANAVLDALLAAGVAPGRLTAAGFGEAEPVADNQTPEGRARNRRIEFRPISVVGGTGTSPEPAPEPGRAEATPEEPQ